MSIFLTLVAIVAGMAALPWILEALRAPMDDKNRADAPGAFVELSDGATHYEWHGPRSDRVLVLVHGLSSPSWVFSGLIRGFLMMGYHVLSYDLYGRGFSDRSDLEQNLDFHVRQLDELITEVGIRMPVTLLGYSMGGAIATQYAAEKSDQVDRLILLAPAGITYAPGMLLAMARDKGRFGDWLWGLLGGRHLKHTARRDAKRPTVIPDVERRIAREVATRGYLAAVLSSERHTLNQSLEAAHREIGAMYIPTLAIWGEDDAVIPVASVGEMARWNRQARHDVIPGAAHSLGYTSPKEVLEAIHEFLREVPE